jgi:Domain of unknown function (DUF4440)
MRVPFYLTVLAYLASASALLAQTAASADSSDAFFRRLIVDRLTAANRGDTVAWRPFLAREAVFINDDGSRDNADEEARRVTGDTSGPPDIDSVHAYQTGEVAVVDYVAFERVHFGPRDVVLRSRLFDTFVRRGGRWLVLRHTNTRILAALTPVVVDSAVLDEYVGRYEWWPGYVDTFTRVGNQLFEQGTGDKKASLNLAATPQAFFVAADPGAGLLVFIRDKTGHIVGYLVHWLDGQVTPARKLP